MNLNHPTLTVRNGDALDAVQTMLGLTDPPETLEADDGGPGYFYHLEDLGFWVFFRLTREVYSIRFDHPYPYRVDGVHIGDSMESVLHARGKPDRHFPIVDDKPRWIYDKPRFLRVDFHRETKRVEHIFR